MSTREDFGVGGILVVRSSGRVYIVVGSRLRGCGCRIFFALANTGTVRHVGRLSPSLVVLSLVLPFVDKSRLVEGVEGFSSMPMVIISTGDLAFGGIRLLHLNTSSCLAGPFSLSRLLTQVRHGLLEDRGSAPGLYLAFKRLSVGASSGVIAITSRVVILATGRCRLMRLLTGCPSGIFSGRGLCRDV